MEWRELVIDGYVRVLDSLKESLAGLTPEELNKQPKPDCNSMGWLAWHISRIQDAEIANLMGADQLWISQKWHAKFNRPPDPDDTGTGQTSKQVAAFKSPDVETLLDYYYAVAERTKKYIRSLTGEELDRKLDEPYQPPPTVGVRLVSVLADNLQHAGEIAYVHGLIKGKGWLGY